MEEDLSKDDINIDEIDFARELEEEESDDFDEDFMDGWSGSQHELNYLFDKYLKAEQVGLTPEEISQVMKEAEHEYKELREKEEAQREVRRQEKELEEIKDQKDDWFGSQHELNYLLDEYLKAEKEGNSPKEISKIMKQAEKSYKELQEESEKKSEEIQKRLDNMDHSDEIQEEEDYDRDQFKDQEEVDYFVDKISEKVSDDTPLEKIEHDVKIDEIQYDVAKIEEDCIKDDLDKGDMSEKEKEDLEKQEFVKELDKMGNEETFPEIDEREEEKREDDNIIEQQVEQEQILVQELKPQEQINEASGEEVEELAENEAEQTQETQETSNNEVSMEETPQESEESLEEIEQTELQPEEISEERLEKEKVENYIDTKTTQEENEKQEEKVKQVERVQEVNEITKNPKEEYEDESRESEEIAAQSEVLEEESEPTRKEKTDQVSEQETDIEQMEEEREEVQEVEEVEEVEEEEEEEEVTEESYESLQEQYHQETGRRAIFKGRETKGFSQWLEEVETEKEILNQKEEEEKEITEEHNQEEEGEVAEEEQEPQDEELDKNWKEILKEWINELAPMLLNPFFTLSLKELIKNIRKYEQLERLYEKFKTKQLTKHEFVEMAALELKLRGLSEINRYIVSNILAFKKMCEQANPWDVSHLKEQFLHRLLKEYESLNKIYQKYEQMIEENIDNPSEKLKDIDYVNKKEFEQFLAYTHRIEPIKDYIDEFNTSGNWLTNFRPTKTFIEFLKIKRNQLKNGARNENSKATKEQEQAENISEYIALLNRIREHDSLNNTIKNLLKNNEGKFNAYDIQQWLLVSDTSARNQLKRILSDEEYEQYVRTQTHVSIETIQAIAKKRGGKCYTKSIKTAKSRLHLECVEGHHFYPTYDSVVYQDTWCPHCHIYVGETICRKFFERIFKRPFPKSYPEWLVNELGNQMELDGYCKELGIAFEYQGIQHRKRAFGMTQKELEKLQKEDKLKAQLCKKHGIILIQVPDDEIVPYDKMQNHIMEDYKKITNNELENIPDFDYKEFNIHENKHAKKFREYVEHKGGTLLTPYFSAKKEVKLLCEKGHPWTTTPDSVYKDNWCSVCSGNIKGDTEYFRKIGKKFGCELISEYINAKTPLWFRCSNGHAEFPKDPYWLKKDQKKIKTLCPHCTKDTYAQNFETFVQKKGGTLLTEYTGRFNTVEIRCNVGHKPWKTTPGAVYQGSWCPDCFKENNPNTQRKEKAFKEFQKMAQKLKYKILSDYENNTKQVKLECDNKHPFKMTPKYFKRLVKKNIEPCSKCRKSKQKE